MKDSKKKKNIESNEKIEKGNTFYTPKRLRIFSVVVFRLLDQRFEMNAHRAVFFD